MSKFLDGIQQTMDYIPEFETVASGTVTVTNSQYPITPEINVLSKKYRNYVLLVNNKSGQIINNITSAVKNVNTILPNTSITTFIPITNPPLNGSTIAAGNTGAAEITPETPNPFITGVCRFNFNLAATATGTIDWALIGY
jgi:hypothetical protein